MKKEYDIIGIGRPCVDYAIRVSQLPKANQGCGVLDASWQGGGVIPTGLVSASRCGLHCAMLGSVGDDLFGQFCIEDLIAHGVDVSWMRVRKGRRTDVGLILSDDETKGRSIVYRGGDYEPFSMEELDLGFLEKADYLYLDSAGELHIEAAKYAKAHGMKTLIDAGLRNLDFYADILPWIDYFIGSEHLYRATFPEGTYRDNLQKVRDMGVQTVVFTFGGKGARALDETGYYEVDAFPVEVVDTLGAGDVFHGAFFYGLKHGYSLPETIRFASAVSAIKCTAIGGRAGIPTEEVTKRFLEDGTIDRSEIDARVAKYAWGIDDFYQRMLSQQELEK